MSDFDYKTVEDLFSYASYETYDYYKNTADEQNPQISDNFSGKFIIEYTRQGSLEVNEDWYNNVTLLFNVTVPSNVTLTIKSGSTIDLDGIYSITSTGGTITVEDFESLEDNYFCLKDADGLIKGLYPSFWSAMGKLLPGMTLDVGSDFDVIYGGETVPHWCNVKYFIECISKS